MKLDIQALVRQLAAERDIEPEKLIDAVAERLNDPAVAASLVTLLDNDSPSGDEQQRSALIYLDQSRQADDSLIPGDQVVVSPLVFVRTGMDIQVGGS